jgi:hypothetical protein
VLVPGAIIILFTPFSIMHPLVLVPGAIICFRVFPWYMWHHCAPSDHWRNHFLQVVLSLNFLDVYASLRQFSLLPSPFRIWICFRPMPWYMWRNDVFSYHWHNYFPHPWQVVLSLFFPRCLCFSSTIFFAPSYIFHPLVLVTQPSPSAQEGGT